MSEMVGGSFTGLTVRRKLLVALPPLLSETMTEMVAAPDWLGAGVTIRARFAPEPPRAILALGTRVGLDELAETARLAGGGTPSAGVETSSSVVWLAMAEMVGTALALGRTKTVKLRLNRLLVAWMSLTVTVRTAVPVALVLGL